MTLVEHHFEGKATCMHSCRHARMRRQTVSVLKYCSSTAAACMGLLDVVVNAPVDVVEDTMQCGGPHSGVPYPPAQGEKSIKHCSHTADMHIRDRVTSSLRMLRPKLAEASYGVQSELLCTRFASEYVVCVSAGQTHHHCLKTCGLKLGKLLPGCAAHAALLMQLENFPVMQHAP